jgi:hypothetical protein
LEIFDEIIVENELAVYSKPGRAELPAGFAGFIL